MNLDASASFDDEAAATLAATFPNLRILDGSSTSITDAGIAHLSRLEQVEELFLVSDSVTTRSFEFLKSMSTLRSLMLGSQLPVDAVGEFSKSIPLTTVKVERPDGSSQIYRNGQVVANPE